MHCEVFQKSIPVLIGNEKGAVCAAPFFIRYVVFLSGIVRNNSANPPFS